MKYLQERVRHQVVAAWVSLGWCVSLTGCAGSHVVDVLGSYFPFWLRCMLLGVAAAFAARVLFLRFHIEPYVGPLPLIYLCVAIAISCLTWLVVS